MHGETLNHCNILVRKYHRKRSLRNGIIGRILLQFLLVVIKLTFTFCRHLLQPIYLLLCLFLYLSNYFSAHSDTLNVSSMCITTKL
jgi:hypothetical protein